MKKFDLNAVLILAVCVGLAFAAAALAELLMPCGAVIG